MRTPNGVDAGDLARRLSENDVLIEPGTAFFAPGVTTSRFYRLAYSSIPAGRIPEGIARIGRVSREMA